jgi:hypothetical protein
MDYLRRTPPRCVRNNASDPHVDIVARLSSDVGTSGFSCFGIRCNCDSRIGSLIGASCETVDGSFWDGPLVFKCSACGRETQIFDPATDGYDAEIGAADDISESTLRSEYSCPSCGAPSHNIALAFGYQMTDVAPDEFRGRDEDFFDACLVYVRCTHCADVSQASVFECA